MTTTAQIRNTLSFGQSSYADNQLKVQRANQLLSELSAIPEAITIHTGLTFQARAELAMLIQDTVGETFNLTETQLKLFNSRGTMRQGVAMPGFVGSNAVKTASNLLPRTAEKLTSEQVLQAAIKQAIVERVTEYKRLLELSCEDALTNLSATIASILAGDDALTIGALTDTSLVLQPLDLPLERIKALALSEKYADMLRLMVDNLSAYKPQNPRIVNDCLLVDCTLTDDVEVQKLADSTMYALTSKKDSPEYKGIQAAIAGIETVQGLEGQVKQLQNKLAEIEKTYIVSKAIAV